jgi:hypothetical protein
MLSSQIYPEHDLGICFKAVCYQSSVPDTPSCPVTIKLHYIAILGVVKCPLVPFKELA